MHAGNYVVRYNGNVLWCTVTIVGSLVKTCFFSYLNYDPCFLEEIINRILS